jgi:hypothetical protein
MDIIPCLLLFFFIEMGKPPIVVSISMPKVYLNGLAKIEDRLVILAFALTIPNSAIVLERLAPVDDSNGSSEVFQGQPWGF